LIASPTQFCYHVTPYYYNNNNYYYYYRFTVPGLCPGLPV